MSLQDVIRRQNDFYDPETGQTDWLGIVEQAVAEAAESDEPYRVLQSYGIDFKQF